MNLLIAKVLFGAKIGKLYHKYPLFLERIKTLKKEMKANKTTKKRPDKSE
jgi:hypothetical protein